MAERKEGMIARDETFDEFLGEQGILAQTEELALNEIIADQIKAAMLQEGITKTENGRAHAH